MNMFSATTKLADTLNLIFTFFFSGAQVAYFRLSVTTFWLTNSAFRFNFQCGDRDRVSQSGVIRKKNGHAFLFLFVHGCAPVLVKCVSALFKTMR